MVAIEVNNLSKSYGKVRALDTPSRLKQQFAAESMDEVFRTLARGAQRGE